MIIAMWFNLSADMQALQSLVFSLNYLVSKRLVWKQQLFTVIGLMPSGSFWVFLIDSLVNECFETELHEKMVGLNMNYELVETCDCFMQSSMVILKTWWMNASHRGEQVFRSHQKHKCLSRPQFGRAKWHGRWSEGGHPCRPDDDVIALSFLLEGEDVKMR